MTLLDAGPLVSLGDEADADHDLCIATLDIVRPPLLTTWAVIAEAMHILGREGGWHAQSALWKLLLEGNIEIVHLNRPHMERARALMEKYRDTPMDLADATLVVLGETQSIHRIFTLDSDFRVYRLHGRDAFEVVPE